MDTSRIRELLRGAEPPLGAPTEIDEWIDHALKRLDGLKQGRQNTAKWYHGTRHEDILRRRREKRAAKKAASEANAALSSSPSPANTNVNS